MARRGARGRTAAELSARAHPDRHEPVARWGAVLRTAGFDATHWSQIGPADATDAMIMAPAAAHDQIVLTHDLDFSAILAVTSGRKPSVVQLRADNASPEAVGSQVIAALRQAADELRSGALLSIDASRARLRILPLRLT